MKKDEESITRKREAEKSYVQKYKNANYRGEITNLRLIYMCTPINTHIYLFIYIHITTVNPIILIL